MPIHLDVQMNIAKELIAPILDKLTKPQLLPLSGGLPTRLIGRVEQVVALLQRSSRATGQRDETHHQQIDAGKIQHYQMPNLRGKEPGNGLGSWAVLTILVVFSNYHDFTAIDKDVLA
jgi:hypothetical protein